VNVKLLTGATKLAAELTTRLGNGVTVTEIFTTAVEAPEVKVAVPL
jgi:hypothetical protein